MGGRLERVFLGDSNKLNPSSSVPLWSLLGFVWGQEQVYDAINGVKFHSGHVAFLLEILGLATVKKLSFPGGS